MVNFTKSRLLAVGATLFLALSFIIVFFFFREWHASILVDSALKPFRRPDLDTTRKVWEFTVERDAENFGLSEEQCLAAFPKLFNQLDKSVLLRKKNKITFEELDSRPVEEGMGRAVIDQGQLFIVDFLERPGQQSRARATLNALQRALIAFPDRHSLPSIEFIFAEGDKAADPEQSGPVWAYTKQDSHNAVWLMPDFGFWGWPEARVGSYGGARDRIAAADTMPFQDKIKELVWRGYVNNYQPRIDLLNVSAGHNWSAVANVKFGDEEDKYLRIEDHCRYMFIAHTEGATYSGRGKYLLNCRSVFIAHSLTWRQPHHAALISHGRDANYVPVQANFSDLPEKMNFLLSHPKIAERIANNSVQTFRDRYLTPAAQTCYWRELIRRYGSVCDFKPERRGIPFEDWVLTQESTPKQERP